MRVVENCSALLDTLAYGAHSVGLDALFMGTPIVTVAGGAMANRVGASLMTAAAQGMYVDASLKAYEDSAVRVRVQAERDDARRHRREQRPCVRMDRRPEQNLTRRRLH